MARFLVIAMLLLFSIAVSGQSIHSIGNGMWQDSTTWDLGRVPRQGDSITIDHIVSSDRSLHVDSLCYLHITAVGTLCMPEDSLFFKCSSFLHNDGMISVYYMNVHDGISNSCFWFYHFYANGCDDSTLFHIDGTNCGTLLCAMPPPRLTPIDTIHYPRVTVTLFPNPTQGDVFVRITPAAPPTGEERYFLELYDLVGKHLLRQENLTMGENPIALPPNLARSAYLWRVNPQAMATNQQSSGVLLVR